MRYTHILWDFNGTLLDDVQTGIDCVNRLLEARALKTIPDKDYYRQIFGFPIRDYYTRLGFDFEKEDYHSLAVEWVTLYNRESPKAPLTPGAREVLESLRQKGVAQYILSATEREMLLRQIRMLGLTGYFHEILGLDNIHAGSKTHLGLEWASRTRPAHALLIGDTVHDFETAAAMRADCILYTGGHMNRSALEQCGCPTVDSLEQVLSFID
ncbi:MAG: HAD family hydrolase [Eubacteriales bacterium]